MVVAERYAHIGSPQPVVEFVSEVDESSCVELIVSKDKSLKKQFRKIDSRQGSLSLYTPAFSSGGALPLPFESPSQAEATWSGLRSPGFACRSWCTCQP